MSLLKCECQLGKSLGTPRLFCAKSAQVAERMGDAFCSLQRVAKSGDVVRRWYLHPRGVCMSIKRKEMREEAFG